MKRNTIHYIEIIALLVVIPVESILLGELSFGGFFTILFFMFCHWAFARFENVTAQNKSNSSDDQ